MAFEWCPTCGAIVKYCRCKKEAEPAYPRTPRDAILDAAAGSTNGDWPQCHDSLTPVPGHAPIDGKYPYAIGGKWYWAPIGWNGNLDLAEPCELNSQPENYLTVGPYDPAKGGYAAVPMPPPIDNGRTYELLEKLLTRIEAIETHIYKPIPDLKAEHTQLPICPLPSHPQQFDIADFARSLLLRIEERQRDRQYGQGSELNKPEWPDIHVCDETQQLQPAIVPIKK